MIWWRSSLAPALFCVYGRINAANLLLAAISKVAQTEFAKIRTQLANKIKKDKNEVVLPTSFQHAIPDGQSQSQPTHQRIPSSLIQLLRS